MLAGFVGFAVISKVPNTLHTPLMSGTNAIHGIVLLGGIVVLGLAEDPSLLDAVVLVVAIVFGTINVVGGFLVTDRMLGMFKPKKPRPQHEAAREHRGPRLRRASPSPLLYIVAFACSSSACPGSPGRARRCAATRSPPSACRSRCSRRCCTRMRHNWLLILVGLVVGTALGVPSARQVRMTAIPQMVALFNGVGGGAVALIAWAEFRTTDASPASRLTS